MIKNISIDSLDAHNNIAIFEYYRGLSAFIVFVTHCWQILLTPVIGNTFISVFLSCASRYSVLVFFLLSGYLISLSINYIIKKNGYFSVSEYLIHRISRIYPPLIFSIILCCLFYVVIIGIHLNGATEYTLSFDKGPVTRSVFDVTLREIYGTVLQMYAINKTSYLSVNGPLWSLSYEVVFYYVIAAILYMKIRIVAGKSAIKKTWLYIAVLLASGYVVINNYNLWVLFYFAIWLYGFTVHANLGRLGKRYYKYSSWIFLLLTLLLYLLYGWSPVSNVESLPNALAQIPFSFLIFNIMSRSTYFRLPLFGFFRRASNYSYTLYICHFPILLFLFSLIHPLRPINSLLYYSLVVVCSLSTMYSCKIFANYLENKNFFRSVLKILSDRVGEFLKKLLTVLYAKIYKIRPAKLHG